jgi:phosphoribosylglycinamide formyltransferase 2
VTQKSGDTIFCPPIGHRQDRGDYQESWQPVNITEAQLKEAQSMAAKVTKELGGAGLWGVEFFLTENEVYFSELSPRPHDTGMVTLAGTQPLNEFELHLRAVLGLPIPLQPLLRAGASAVILAEKHIENPTYVGIDKAMKTTDSDLRIFGKPSAHEHRRMGVALVYAPVDTDMKALRSKAIDMASKVKVK